MRTCTYTLTHTHTHTHVHNDTHTHKHACMHPSQHIALTGAVGCVASFERGCQGCCSEPAGDRSCPPRPDVAIKEECVYRGNSGLCTFSVSTTPNTQCTV